MMIHAGPISICMRKSLKVEFVGLVDRVICQIFSTYQSVDCILPGDVVDRFANEVAVYLLVMDYHPALVGLIDLKYCFDQCADLASQPGH